MSETAKIRERVMPYCEGTGIDLGCGSDKVRPEAIGVDLRDLPGVNVREDASGKLAWVMDEQFDYVYSSHFLEHVERPLDCLREWARILKTGGYLILYLPHKDHYTEYNPEHKQFLTMEMVFDWLDLVGGLEVKKSMMDVGPDRYSFLIIAEKGG